MNVFDLFIKLSVDDSEVDNGFLNLHGILLLHICIAAET